MSAEVAPFETSDSEADARPVSSARSQRSPPRANSAASLAAAIQRVQHAATDEATFRALTGRGRLDAIEERDNGVDADEAYDEAVFEILDEMVLGDTSWGDDPYGNPPDSARMDLAVDMGRTALESILRNVTLVVSTRIAGSFNTSFVPQVIGR
jgi:hypothetical protein